MGNQNGVSVLEIVISIIILILLAFFAIYNSQNSVGKAEASELYSEMKSVQTAVESIRLELITRDGFSLNQDEHYDEVDPESGAYIIYGNLENPDGKAAKYLGIDNLKRDYIVDYDDNNGNIRLRKSVDINGTQIISIKQLEAYLGISK